MPAAQPDADVHEPSAWHVNDGDVPPYPDAHVTVRVDWYVLPPLELIT